MRAFLSSDFYLNSLRWGGVIDENTEIRRFPFKTTLQHWTRNRSCLIRKVRIEVLAVPG